MSMGLNQKFSIVFVPILTSIMTKTKFQESREELNWVFVRVHNPCKSYRQTSKERNNVK